jgi:small subunit ribosomal protein S20
LANKKSAEKRYRQSLVRRLKNRQAKSEIKTAIKNFTTSIDKKDKEAAEKAFQTVQKLMDTAAGKGTLHKNSVARKKSRLSKKFTLIGGHL